ncbi:DUF983 domain-containing protein [Azospirillum sp. YIM DDC1]|uniref:DUF983 domain-containing protein n=1 Tax=Azospirillum aestuarii TaxID=2802052 RepID=A0ABS1I0D1_9PROT|nr:DUF983 domain-containing protein [Azospirillum aestuarii]MBK3777330.1 DUF983 domain-containing protein [Azospirillum brasilense]MBK4720113.1 DUF983 domain-containing protein [Azospirillum aestuarii]TWA89715.1 uncharacterized protein (DUF983 family) [Azospirillum brasilense]
MTAEDRSVNDGAEDGARSKTTAALRGLMGNCPACGRGRLLRNYLKPVDHCTHCGEAFGHLRADDAPPWMTILIVGHIVIPAVLSVEQSYEPATWVHLTIWPLLTLLLTGLLLPRCKGVVLGLLWSTGAPGSERA